MGGQPGQRETHRPPETQARAWPR